MALCMHKDLSEEADRLLGGTEKDSDRPSYSESYFNRKLRIAQKRAHRHEILYGVSGVERDEIASRLIDQVLDAAKLTAAQREIFELRRQGMGWSEIGRLRGHSKQAAEQTYWRAWPKVLAAAKQFAATAELSQVYADEVRERLQFLGHVDEH